MSRTVELHLAGADSALTVEGPAGLGVAMSRGDAIGSAEQLED